MSRDAGVTELGSAGIRNRGVVILSVQELSPATFSDAEADVYKSVSRAAVASLILGFVGLIAFPLLPVLLLSIVGLAFTLVAVRGFRRFPDELLGRPLAWVGGAICLLTVVCAPAYHTYVYMTEVPEGYTRLNFAVLKSGRGEPDEPTAAALEMDGKKVFLKGYIHPSSMDASVSRRFVLVPDLGTCCFGGQPPLTHMIEVSLTGDQFARRSLRKQRLAGTLKVKQNLKPIDGLTGVFYQLRADILK